MRSQGHLLLFRKVKAHGTDKSIDTRGNNRADTLAELGRREDQDHHLTSVLPPLSLTPPSPTAPADSPPSPLPPLSCLPNLPLLGKDYQGGKTFGIGRRQHHITSMMTSYLEMDPSSSTFPLGRPSHARLADTPPTEMRTRTTHLGALGANHYSALRCGPAVGCEILLWSPTCAGRGDWKQDARMPRSLLDPQRREQLRSL